MILIADSGSTKTAWRFIDEGGNIFAFSSMGFNPFFWKSAAIAKEINKKCPKKIKLQVSNHKSRVFFYGAGCSSKKRINIVKTALRKNFPQAKIFVEHDLLGSARAVCGDEKGIATILGTGSNSCYYDGEKVVRQRGGWGYIISDEGSGAHIGKKLMRDFINENLPAELSEKLHMEYKLTREKVVQSVYNKPYPNRFLASFGKFIHENIHEPYCSELVKKRFTEFFENHICRYDNYKELPMGCVGSVGYYFKNILQEVANVHNVRLGKVIESPIDELVKFHLNEK
ncbi:MAG: N-acetylglucosamine kinase [Bacteroidetes bacterium]|nr:N-acetylglucosamine kinase [Bacteroidota bacterium]